MTPSEIHIICKKYGIIDYTINDDMSISVEGDVNLTHKNLKSLPIKFKEVGGYFWCSVSGQFLSDISLLLRQLK